MKFRVVHQPTTNHARSAFRIVEQTTGREVEWVNRYLDYECLRRVADLTLRSYAQHLLHFLRWWESVHHTDVIVGEALTESTLLDYVRFQSAQQPPFSGSTINQRVAVADRALRATFPDAPRQVAPEFQVSYWRRAPMGLGRPLPAVSRLRVREPKRTIVPLSIDDVARFWASFHTSRDLAIVGLMLLQGLRLPEEGPPKACLGGSRGWWSGSHKKPLAVPAFTVQNGRAWSRATPRATTMDPVR